MVASPAFAAAAVFASPSRSFGIFRRFALGTITTPSLARCKGTAELDQGSLSSSRAYSHSQQSRTLAQLENSRFCAFNPKVAALPPEQHRRLLHLRKSFVGNRCPSLSRPCLLPLVPTAELPLVPSLLHPFTLTVGMPSGNAAVEAFASAEAREKATEEQGQAPPRKRFGILLTGNASPYTEQVYGDYGRLFIELLKDEGEEWHVFRVIDGHFPSDDEIPLYDGWVITGSRHNAHGAEEWILRLCDVLRSIHQKTAAKTLGVCFGHQVLSRALGGETGPAPGGWNIGHDVISPTDALKAKTYARDLPSTVGILVVHRDQVCSLPPGAELLASSPAAPVQMFGLGDSILGIQGHPEFRRDIVEDLICSRMDLGVIPADVAERGLRSLAHQEDHEALRQLCKRFLKGT